MHAVSGEAAAEQADLAVLRPFLVVLSNHADMDVVRKRVLANRLAPIRYLYAQQPILQVGVGVRVTVGEVNCIVFVRKLQRETQSMRRIGTFLTGTTMVHKS